EPFARGEVERNVVESCNPVGLRASASGLPGVEPQVVVVAAGGDEQDFSGGAPSGNIAGLEHHVEAEGADVEIPHAADVRGPKMDVADSDLRVDRVVGGLHRIHRSLRPAHDPSLTTRRGIWNGSRVRKPPLTCSIGAAAASSR